MKQTFIGFVLQIVLYTHRYKVMNVRPCVVVLLVRDIVAQNKTMDDLIACVRQIGRGIKVASMDN
jgi:hypothetical protein